MKAVITMLALMLGTSLIAAVFVIQRNPLAYTSQDPVRRQVQLEIGTVAAPVIRLATEADSPAPVDELIIRPDPTPKKMSKSTRTARPRARVEEPAEASDVVEAPPCVDGEYRLLDEKRGVRLSCGNRE